MPSCSAEYQVELPSSSLSGGAEPLGVTHAKPAQAPLQPPTLGHAAAAEGPVAAGPAPGVLHWPKRAEHPLGIDA